MGLWNKFVAWKDAIQEVLQKAFWLQEATSNQNKSMLNPNKISFQLLGFDMLNPKPRRPWPETSFEERYGAFAHCKEPSCVEQLKDSPIVAVPTAAWDESLSDF